MSERRPIIRSPDYGPDYDPAPMNNRRNTNGSTKLKDVFVPIITGMVLLMFGGAGTLYLQSNARQVAELHEDLVDQENRLEEAIRREVVAYANYQNRHEKKHDELQAAILDKNTQQDARMDFLNMRQESLHDASKESSYRVGQIESIIRLQQDVLLRLQRLEDRLNMQNNPPIYPYP